MRLPVAVPPARHEIGASSLARLARLHGLARGELWYQVSSPQPGTRRREVVPDRLAAITGRPAEHLAWALPELHDPGPDWQAWRHRPQPGCPRCDARHDGGPVTRLLPHHHYVCARHRYWIGPPDAGQPATPLGPGLADIVQAQRRHLRLLRRYGPEAAYDAVLTGFLLCGHLRTDQPANGPRYGSGGPAAPRSSSRPAPNPPSSAPPGSSPPPTPKPSASPASSPRPPGAAAPPATPPSSSNSPPRSGSGSASPAASPPAPQTRSRTG